MTTLYKVYFYEIVNFSNDFWDMEARPASFSYDTLKNLAMQKNIVFDFRAFEREGMVTEIASDKGEKDLEHLLKEIIGENYFVILRDSGTKGIQDLKKEKKNLFSFSQMCA